MTIYFITGATGAVGSALCERLLLHSDAELRLLIRGVSDEDVSARLNKLFEFWSVDEKSPTRLRVQALRGDATQRCFGLDPKQYESLARECGSIVHSAGAVRMNLSLEAARHSALDSAREIIQLAHRAKQLGTSAKVEFISTVGVGGRLPGALPERWINETRQFHNTYEQAKAEAEVIVQDAISSGLCITVHRPSMVVGDSLTGKILHFQVFYHLAEFLSGRRTFGIGPDPGNARLDLVPADCVAKAIEWSSRNADMCGAILHLCSGPDGSIAVRDLISVVRAEFAKFNITTPKLRIVRPAAFTAMANMWSLVASEKNKRALRTLPIFLEYLSDAQTFSNTRSTAMLESVGINLPACQSFLPTVLSHYLAHRTRNV